MNCWPALLQLQQKTQREVEVQVYLGMAALGLLACSVAPCGAQQLSADVSAALTEADALGNLLGSLELAKCRAGLPSKVPCPGLPSVTLSLTLWLRI